MFYFLLTLLVLDALLLVAVVLLQAGKGGGLAGLGGGMASTETLFGSRQAANLLTKASWWTGGIFLLLSLALSGLSSSRGAARESILRQNARGLPPVTAPAPALPAVTQPANEPPGGNNGAAPANRLQGTPTPPGIPIPPAPTGAR